MAREGGSSVVSIFAMVLLTLLVIVILYFVVYKGFFNKKTEIDVNINPGGSYKLHESSHTAFNAGMSLQRLAA